MKNIEVRIGVVQKDDSSRFSKLEGTFAYKCFEDNIDREECPINFIIEDQPQDIWDDSRVNFGWLLREVPYIIVIKDIYVPVEIRHRCVGSEILNTIAELFAKDSLIFAYVSISPKEYPSLRYTTEPTDDGRELIDRYAIIRDNLRFLSLRYFLEVSGYTNADRNHSIMLYDGPMGHIAKEYMECSIVSKGKHAEKKINKIYRNLFYHTLAMSDLSGVNYYDPYINNVIDEFGEVNESLFIVPKEELEEKHSWYSGYKGETTAEFHDNMSALRKSICKYGGAEVQLLANRDPKDCFPKPYDFAMNCTDLKYQPEYLVCGEDEDPDEVSDEEIDNMISQRFARGELPDVVKMSGHALHESGIWYDTQWYFDTKTGTILDDFMAFKPLALIGHIDCVYDEL